MKIPVTYKGVVLMLVGSALLLYTGQAAWAQAGKKAKPPAKPAIKTQVKKSISHKKGPAIQSKLDKVKKRKKESVFKGFVKGHPGVGHKAGTVKGGTFILKHKDQKPKKPKKHPGVCTDPHTTLEGVIGAESRIRDVDIASESDTGEKGAKSPKPEPPKKDTPKDQGTGDLVDDEGSPGYCDRNCKSFEECMEHQTDCGGS